MKLRQVSGSYQRRLVDNCIKLVGGQGCACSVERGVDSFDECSAAAVRQIKRVMAGCVGRQAQRPAGWLLKHLTTKQIRKVPAVNVAFTQLQGMTSTYWSPYWRGIVSRRLFGATECRFAIYVFFFLVKLTEQASTAVVPVCSPGISDRVHVVPSGRR